MIERLYYLLDAVFFKILTMAAQTLSKAVQLIIAFKYIMTKQILLRFAK